MDLRKLTNKNLIFLDVGFKNKDEVIHSLIDRLYLEGKLSSKEKFYRAVMDREKLSPTGIGEQLAIPHGKSAAVKEAAFAIAVLKDEIEWESIDDEDVNLVILLAIPEAEKGSTHLDLLAKLTTKLADDDFREELIKSKTPEELIETLVYEEDEEIHTEIEGAKTIVCVTACPAGIAHTYMAAKALENAGKELGVNIVVEKQGAKGIEDKISESDLEKADGVIFAVGVAVKEKEKFDGLPLVEVPVAEPLRRAKELIEEVLKLSEEQPKGERVKREKKEPRKISPKEEAKRALLTGISHIVPLIVAGGTILAIAVFIAQTFGMQELYNTDGSWLWLCRNLGGRILGTLMVPVLSAYIAFSLGDKPALGPGFAAGVAANIIGGGFLGGMAGGFIAGYSMRWIKKNVKLSKTFDGFLTFYLYPVLGTLIAGSLMLFVVGKPIALLNTSLTDFLEGLSGGNAIILGAVLGAMVSFDLGGPVNKAAYVFCIGTMANGNFMPYAAFASIKMVSGFTTTAVTMLKPKLFKEFERETGKSTWILALAGITEGSIPLMIEDPFRVIPSFMIGSAVTGAIVAVSNIGLSVPGAGIFSMLVMESSDFYSKLNVAGIWLGAAMVGTVISTIVLILLRTYKKN